MDKQIIRVVKVMQGVGTEELAARAGVSRYSAWKWESGRHPVGTEVARKLEDALLGRNGTGTDAREKSGAA